MLLSKLLLQDDIVDCKINNLRNNSLTVMPGDLFIAYPGVNSDGRMYINQAITQGAVAVLYDPCGNFIIGEYNVPCVAIENLALKLSELACRFYDDPSKKLKVIGVTGTNGKTTIAYQLAQAYELLGVPTIYIGTLGTGKINALQASNNTTPDALYIQQMLFEQLQSGVKCVCMEVSSHALVQNRVEHIAFDQAIYTNLSHEHLDYHQTMDAYAAAKAKLFAFESVKLAIINQDDAFAGRMQASAQCKTLTYGLTKNCDIYAFNINMSMTGSKFEVLTPYGQRLIAVNVLGAFNIYNSLAVLASLLGSGYDLDSIVTIMAQLKASPGRMEVVSKQPCVLIDYAHTPDALKNVLLSMLELKPKSGKIWVVFGCGGDRDALKRPLMGSIASEYADHIIITSDNPRTESPEQIINEIISGLSSDQQHIAIVDRTDAINYALTHANADDLVLIAGKGHESYQIIGKQRLDFSDHEVVRKF